MGRRRSNPYLNMMQKIMRDATPPPATSETREEIEQRIALISEALKGPMSSVERLDLVEARQIARKQLAAYQ